MGCCEVRVSWPCLLAVVLTVLASGGCGCGQATGSVSGVVTFQGQPLPGGAVMFWDATGKLHQQPIGADGKYYLSGLALGDARVTVDYVDEGFNKYARDYAAGKGATQPSTAQPSAAQVQLAGRGGAVTLPKTLGPAPPPELDTSGLLILPARYKHPDQSGLRLGVQRGANSFDIVLE